MMNTSRREFLKLAGLGAAALTLPGWSSAFDAPVASRPNILYILADDLGYGDVHCLNPEHGKIPTPNIDQLASQGLIFTGAHGGSSVCTPTRYGLLTGRYAWRSRLQAGVLDAAVAPLIAVGRLTVGEFLRRQGYATAAIGKWHLGYTYDAPASAKKKGGGEGGSAGVPVGTRIVGGPTTRGFDTFFGFHHARSMRTTVENDRVVEETEPIEMLPKLCRKAVDYVAQHGSQGASGKPFFLYLALSAPHGPIVPAPAWQGKSGLNAYGDFVMQVDDVVGQVLAALDRLGATGNTLVIFASDNGCSPIAKLDELESKGHYPSAAMRGYKADIWDGGHRIPFIVRWPGRVKTGAACNQLVCLTDLLATCAELNGVKLPGNAGEDSVSILPALLGTARGPLRESVVHHSISGRFAIRQGDWKLELCPGSGGWGQPGDPAAKAAGAPEVQLYDLAKDPAEQHNLQSDNPEVVRRLTKLLEKIVADGRSTPGTPQRNDVAVDLYKTALNEGKARNKAKKKSAKKKKDR